METWREELYANELYHYGVKGMKWRHRKTPNKPDDLNWRQMQEMNTQLMFNNFQHY